MTDAFEFHGLQPVLLVNDIQSTADYYAAVLGFEVDFMSGSPPDHARVSRGDGSPSTVRIRFELAREKEIVSPSGYLYIHIGRNLDKLCEQYRSKGVTILTQPSSHDWGLRDFYVEDCNGYVLCFAQEISEYRST